MASASDDAEDLRSILAASLGLFEIHDKPDTEFSSLVCSPAPLRQVEGGSWQECMLTVIAVLNRLIAETSQKFASILQSASV